MPISKPRLLILGSGPSAPTIQPYLGHFDCTLVINGAIKLVPDATHMIVQDRAADKQDWFSIPTPKTERYIDYLLSEKDPQPHIKWFPQWSALPEYEKEAISYVHFKNNPDKFVLSKDLLLNNRHHKYLFGHFSCVTFALDLAYTLGYTDVCMCGIDMCDKGRIYYEGLGEDESIYSVKDTEKFKYPVTEYQYYCISMLNAMTDIYSSEMKIVDLSDGNLNKSISAEQYFNHKDI
jgi:hypothetical protein